MCINILVYNQKHKKSQKIPKWVLMNNQTYFFGKIISYTCDLHLKLNILNPSNIFFYQMVKKMSLLPCNLFLQNFKTLKFLYDLIFYQVHPMNMYSHRKGHDFVVYIFWNQLYDSMHSFDFIFFKCKLNTWYS
jgi:hypothetical protein